MERVFQLYSPNLESIELIRSGKVRRAKLYYLRDRKGKSARINEKIKKKIGLDLAKKEDFVKIEDSTTEKSQDKKEDLKK